MVKNAETCQKQNMNWQTPRDERQFKASTGLSYKEFDYLVDGFKSTYKRLYGGELGQGIENIDQEIWLTTYEDCLYLVLFQLKNDLTNDVLGAVFGVSRATANTNFLRYLKVLHQALIDLGNMPKREFKNVADFKKHFKGKGRLLIDATEQQVDRPKGKEAQKARYSGKKTTHL